MKKIIAFAGSNHSKSINKQLVSSGVSLITEMQVDVLDISSWNIPIYSIDMDPDKTPDEIASLINLIHEYDGFIVSSPEHNGGTPAFFKNIIDWLSRRSKVVFNNKPMLLMSTSPGQGGGKKNRQFLETLFMHLGANIVASYTLPSFYRNVKEGKIEDGLSNELQRQVDKLIHYTSL